MQDDVLVVEDIPIVEEAVVAPEAEAPPAVNIAIIGYTSTRAEAPWDDPAWNRWICNNLHQFVPDKWERLYDLHAHGEIVKDVAHEAFLRKCRKPVYVFEPQADWPGSVAFPKDEVTGCFGRYFTNSISWMTAHAIMEIVTAADAWAEAQAKQMIEAQPGLGALLGVLQAAARSAFLGGSTIGIWGVDMAQGTEYAAQRPSCEYFLGHAAGIGIKIFVPPASDLLKNIALYGAEDDSAIRAKMENRENDLTQRMGQMQAQQNELFAQLNQMQGALEDTRYWKGVWLNPHAERDGSPKGSTGGAAEATQSDGAGVVTALAEA